MKKNLKNSWLKNNIIFLNISILLLYAIAFWLYKTTHFLYLINFIGFIYLLFISPLNILILLHWKFKNLIDYLLACLVIFFTIITPFWFFANALFHISLSQKNILLFNALIFIIYIITIILKKELPTSDTVKQEFTLPILSIHKIFFDYWPLLFILSLYGLMHFINYHFYVFMPEWDGYTNLINIKKYINDNTIPTTYRGFFTVAVILLSNFAKINLYSIFTFWFILLQTSQIFILYQLAKIHGIKNKIHNLLLLSTALAIPVINMEIDMTRPQNVLLILMPIYIYYSYLALKNNKIKYWILTILISVMGLNYHEFFIFTLFIQVFITINLSFSKYWVKALDKKNKIIFILLLIILLLLFILANDYIPAIHGMRSRLALILSQVKQIEHWRWWFLNNYVGDNSGQQVGWPGLFGAIKYYAYYISPVVLFLSFILALLIWIKQISFKSIILKITLPLIILLFTCAEILPRLNYFFLPERVLLVLDLTMLPLVIFIYKTLKQSFSPKILKLFLISLLLLNFIGMIGSFYVAWQKKSLTSPNEFIAAQWIKENTEKDSLFITQAASAVTIEYFASRSIIKTPTNFFDGEAEISPNTSEKMLLPVQQINQRFKLLQKELQTTIISDSKDIDQIMSSLLSTKKSVYAIEKRIISIDYHAKPSIYALYSMDKFKGLYAKREWWLKANHYGAKIENLTKKYPLVYNENGIYIWKIK